MSAAVATCTSRTNSRAILADLPRSIPLDLPTCCPSGLVPALPVVFRFLALFCLAARHTCWCRSSRSLLVYVCVSCQLTSEWVYIMQTQVLAHTHTHTLLALRPLSPRMHVTIAWLVALSAPSDACCLRISLYALVKSIFSFYIYSWSNRRVW